MNGDDADAPADAVDDLAEQADDLCRCHDHVTRVIANLDVPTDAFSDYRNPGRADFPVDGVVQLFLYKEVRGFDQTETARRLRGAAYVYVRFDLPRPPSQGGISWMWRNRFTPDERRLIKDAADRIRAVCEEHDVVERHEPALEPEDVQGTAIEEEQIMSAVERATETGFKHYDDPRGPNISYELQAYFERQGYLNLAEAGTTTERRRFARLSDRGEVPHGSTHNRTMKKVADPDPQTSLWDFEDGEAPEWRRIRDEVLPFFHRGVEEQLDEIAGRDRTGIREPVHAAIDITTFPFWPSPTKAEEDVSPDDEPVEKGKGEFHPKEDFPEMVSGFKKDKKEVTERGYKFATITIVAEDTPVVLGIEPVRDYSWWERRPEEEVETTGRGEIVERLLEQAEQHVDVHKLFCDREFDSFAVRDAADRRGIQYVVGKQRRSSADYENIEEITEDPVYDSRIEHAWQTHEGREHKVSIIYLPGGEYSLFTVNGWVEPGRAQALTGQYRKRWRIENQYKSIKENFLPRTATKDYRVRFLYFVIGATLYNVWRLANFLLRDEVEADLGEDPPLSAGEVVELVGLCLFDPGG